MVRDSERDIISGHSAVQWGQFLTHDMDHIPEPKVEESFNLEAVHNILHHSWDM